MGKASIQRHGEDSLLSARGAANGYAGLELILTWYADERCPQRRGRALVALEGALRAYSAANTRVFGRAYLRALSALPPPAERKTLLAAARKGQRGGACPLAAGFAEFLWRIASGSQEGYVVTATRLGALALACLDEAAAEYLRNANLDVSAPEPGDFHDIDLSVRELLIELKLPAEKEELPSAFFTRRVFDAGHALEDLLRRKFGPRLPPRSKDMREVLRALAGAGEERSTRLRLELAGGGQRVDLLLNRLADYGWEIERPESRGAGFRLHPSQVSVALDLLKGT